MVPYLCLALFILIALGVIASPFLLGWMILEDVKARKEGRRS